MTDDELAELVRSVLSRPDDHELLRVYADGLIERGDPRGELVVVQLGRIEADNLDLVARERELLATLNASLAGKLRRDVVGEWWLGFLDAIDFAATATHGGLVDAIRELGRDIAARRLRRVVFRGGFGSLQSPLAALARIAPQLKNLRELAITRHPRDPSAPPDPSHIGDIDPLSRACPKLEVLELDGNEYRMRDAKLPCLRKLAVAHANVFQISALARVDMPGLHELAIHIDKRLLGYRAGGDLFEREYARLRVLTLESQDAAAMAEVTEDLPWAPLFRSVRVLVLGGAIDEVSIRNLERRAPQLRQLERIEVAVDGEARQRLARALGHVLR